MVKDTPISPEILDPILQEKKRITIFQANGTYYWCKQDIETFKGFPVLVKIGNFLIKCLGLEHLALRQSYDDALSTEKQRLRALKAAGLNVPDIIQENKHYVVLSHLGHSLTSMRSQVTYTESVQLLNKAIEALHSIHQKGLYLSAAVYKNITADEQHNLGFVDFEEDPGQIMALEAAQARDWLLFIHSISLNNESSDPSVLALLQEKLTQSHEISKKYLRKTRRLLGWITYLPGLSRIGRDPARFVLTMQRLKQLDLA